MITQSESKHKLSKEWINELLSKGVSKNSLTESNSDWLNSIRHNAELSIEHMKMPTRKDEIWRYSNLDKIFSQPFKLADKTSGSLPEFNLDAHIIPGLESYQIVIANGCCIPDLDNMSDLPEGVDITGLQDALSLSATPVSTFLGQLAGYEAHIFSVLNTALINDGVFIHIGAGIKLDKPIEIITITTESESSLMIQPRNLLVMEKGASATIIERYISNDQFSDYEKNDFKKNDFKSNDVNSCYFNNNLIEIILHDDAALNHYRIQDESKQAYHMGSIFVSQMTRSEYKHTTYASGGHWARTDIHVDFNGQSAQCQLNGLYSVGKQQLIDFHTKVQHHAPGCLSQERFKGILYGKGGRAVFDGHIIVDKDAQATDAHMSTSNLLLTRNAEIDTKPQLEIYADNVKCSHGATVGQLEAEQIFYLRSRGINESRAKQILCIGFAAEIINTIQIKSLVEIITKQLQEKILVLNDVV